ncbi:MAG TPA: response regulator [Candidatus Acidoferrales bacterium]|nr:response regulator [Candidatus Acidoferrales bacterium]
MRIVRLRCFSCGTRSEVTFGDLETRELRTQKFINRNCRICRGVTRHEVLSGAGPSVETFGGFQDDIVAEAADAVRPRALIIEDDPDSRAVLAKALAAAHFDSVAVGDGREALQILVREDFAVILSDINMPELDGKQLFEFLDKNLPDARGRVIFVTGETGNPATRDFLESTGQPYLPKPVELPLLFVLLEAIAGGGSEPPSPGE